MAIEFNGLQGRPLSSAGTGGQVTPNGQRSSAVDTGPAARDDQVSLTNSASRLRKLENEVSQLPMVDSTRVIEVQQALATNSFKIDPAQVADKLLAMETALP